MKKLFLNSFIILIMFIALPCFAAIDPDTVWEIRIGAGDDSNGGGFNDTNATPGTDFSQQDAAQDSGTDLASADGDASPCVVTSATHNFVDADEGNIINIFEIGTGFTHDRYEIFTTSAGGTPFEIVAGKLFKTGAPQKATETNPFTVKANVIYRVVADITSAQDAAVTVNIGGGSEILMSDGEFSGGESFIKTVYITTINTDSFSLVASGSGQLFEMESISVREAGTGEFAIINTFDLNVAGDTVLNNLNVEGAFALNTLLVNQSPVGNGPVDDVVIILGSNSDSESQGGGGITVILGNASGGQEAGSLNVITGGGSSTGSGSIFLTTRKSTSASNYGNIFLVKDGGKVIIGSSTPLTTNRTGLEVDGNITITGNYGTLTAIHDKETTDNILDYLPTDKEKRLNADNKISNEILLDGEWDYETAYNYSLPYTVKENGYDVVKYEEYDVRVSWSNVIAENNRFSVVSLRQENQMLKDKITIIEAKLNITDETPSPPSDLYDCSYREPEECQGGLSGPNKETGFQTRCYKYLKIGWSTCSTGWIKI